jgi:beta-galactosidase
MKKTFILLSFFLCASSLCAQSAREHRLLTKNWKFNKGDFPAAARADFDDAKWEAVAVPHDWAIYGPFDERNDLQDVAILQNMEKKATLKTGRTGGLPYIGVGWYRTALDVPEYNAKNQQVTLQFDGAMSEARVYVNGREIGFWPYGYNSFHFDITDFLNADGKKNVVAVRLENRPQSSRWYPGAGLYRNVHLIVADKTHVPVWGTYITTPFVSGEYASVKLKTNVANVPTGQSVRIVTEILDGQGATVAFKDNAQQIIAGQPVEQNFIVNAPQRWSPESPYLYRAVSKIYVDNRLADEYSAGIGVRSVSVHRVVICSQNFCTFAPQTVCWASR